MAQSNGDEELRERVTKLLWGGRTDVDGVMQLFEAYRKKHELEALKSIAKDNYAEDLGTYDFDGIAEDVFHRIKELEEL